MTVLMTVYGIGANHAQYQYKLKNRLQNTFGDTITFLSPDYHSTQLLSALNVFRNRVYLLLKVTLSQK